MLRVLQDWDEVGQAIVELQGRCLPLHESPQKNWDHLLLTRIFSSLPEPVRVVDLGCGGAFTLRLLTALGCPSPLGLDIKVQRRARLAQAADWARARTLRPPYRIRRADLTHTGLPPASCDLISCISTIEHGVDGPALFRECARILRPGGALLITTDYWQDPIPAPSAGLHFGLPWRVFDRGALAELVEGAARCRLRLIEEGPLPRCADRVTRWSGCEYTFAALGLRKAEQ